MKSWPTLALVSLGVSLVACHKDPAKPPSPPPTPPPSPAIIDAAVAPPLTAVAPTAVVVAMPGPDDIKAARALTCTARKAGSGCTDAAGAEVIPFVHEEPIEFKASGLALVKPEGAGWSFVDARNQVVLEPFYFDNGPDELHDGLARVVKDGKVGFVDEQWRLVISPRFDAAFGFDGGVARVCTGCDPRIWSEEAPPEAYTRRGREFWIDRTGKDAPKPPSATSSVPAAP